MTSGSHVLVEGYSMFPSLQSGDILKIHPNAIPQLGQLVFCQLGEVKFVHRLSLKKTVKGDRNKTADGKLDQLIVFGLATGKDTAVPQFAKFLDQCLATLSYFNDRKFRGIHYFFSGLLYFFGSIRRIL